MRRENCDMTANCGLRSPHETTKVRANDLNHRAANSSSSVFASFRSSVSKPTVNQP
jgi:hypothetical protein